MVEAGAVGPEIVYVAKADASPLDQAKRKVFDFVKSQVPSQHARRTMEKIDWVGDQLEGTSRELYEKLRPAAEKAAQVAGVATTTMEVVLALEVAVGASLLLGTKGGREALGGLINTVSEKHPNVRDRVTKIVTNAKQSAGSARSALGRLMSAIGASFERKAPDIIAGSVATAGATAVVAGMNTALRPTPERNQPRSGPAKRDVNIVDMVHNQRANTLLTFAHNALQPEAGVVSSSDQGVRSEIVVRNAKNDQVVVVRKDTDTHAVTIQHIDLLRRRMRTIVVPTSPDERMSGSYQVFTAQYLSDNRGELERGRVSVSQNMKGVSTYPLRDSDFQKVLTFIKESEAAPHAPDVTPAAS